MTKRSSGERSVFVLVSEISLRNRPELAQLPDSIPADKVEFFLDQFNSRREYRAYRDAEGLHIESADEVRYRDREVDDLGLPIGDAKYHDICDVIADQSNIDPRRMNVHSMKGSVFESLGLGARVTGTLHGPTGDKTTKGRYRGKRHPADEVGDDEIRRRREILEERKKRLKNRRKKRGDYDDIFGDEKDKF